MGSFPNSVVGEKTHIHWLNWVCPGSHLAVPASSWSLFATLCQLLAQLQNLAVKLVSSYHSFFLYTWYVVKA